MSPEQPHYNPFNSPEFREEMSKMFDEKLGDVKGKVEKHDEWINQQKGAGKVIHYGLTIVVSAVSGFAARYLK